MENNCSVSSFYNKFVHFWTLFQYTILPPCPPPGPFAARGNLSVFLHSPFFYICDNFSSFSQYCLQFLCLLNVKHTKMQSSRDLWETGKCSACTFKDTWWQRLWLTWKNHPCWCSQSCSQKIHTFLELRDSHNLLWNSFLLSPSGLKKCRCDFLTRRD